jgi:hypothetical protein
LGGSREDTFISKLEVEIETTRSKGDTVGSNTRSGTTIDANYNVHKSVRKDCLAAKEWISGNSVGRKDSFQYKGREIKIAFKSIRLIS